VYRVGGEYGSDRHDLGQYIRALDGHVLRNHGRTGGLGGFFLTLKTYANLILTFPFETTNTSGITQAYAALVITSFYEEASTLLELDAYDAASTLIDNTFIGSIVIKAASRYLEALYHSRYRDQREKDKSPNVPEMAFNEKEAAKIKSRRVNKFEQITLIDRFD
jgi:hypothetical protein